MLDAIVLTALILLASDYPFVLEAWFAVPALLAPFFLLGAERVPFSPQHLEIRSLRRRRTIPYRAITSFTLDDDGVLLRLRSGDSVRLRMRTYGTPTDKAHLRRITRDEIGYVISWYTRLVPTSGAIERAGDRELPAVTRPGRSDALTETLRAAGRIARARRGAEIEVRDLVSAVVAGPDRSVLIRAGLSDTAPFAPEAGPPYRDSEPPVESEALGALIGAATIAVANRGRSDVDPLDLLVALHVDRDTHVEPLVAAGVTHVRLLDAIAHGLSAAESDARLFAEIPDAELLAGIEGTQAGLVLINDDYTTFEYVVKVLQSDLQYSSTSAAEFAKRVHDEGRASAAVMEAAEAARVARRLMQMARLRNQPLLVVLEPE